MKTLYMFDVDETLEVSHGPIKLSQLVNLFNQGHIIGLCGNWGLFVNVVQDWHRVISVMGCWPGQRKHEFLREAKRIIPADRYIMIGNVNPSNAPYSDRDEAILARWEFIEEKDFLEGLDVT